MASPASIAKHPIHPMLVVFPIGLWVFSFVMDLVHFFGHGTPIWEQMALYTMVGGIIGALCAAVPGFIDFLSLKGKVRRIAKMHMGLNLTLVVLYAINAFLRLEGAFGAPMILSLAGIIMLGISGWLGGEMVYVHGVAVESKRKAEKYRDEEEERELV
jgi:uncharacterized membrane protein